MNQSSLNSLLKPIKIKLHDLQFHHHLKLLNFLSKIELNLGILICLNTWRAACSSSSFDFENKNLHLGVGTGQNNIKEKFSYIF